MNIKIIILSWIFHHCVHHYCMHNTKSSYIFSKHINSSLYAWFQIIIHIISTIVSIITITHHAQNVKSSNMIQIFIFKIFITVFMYDNKVFMIPNIKSTMIHFIKSLLFINNKNCRYTKKRLWLKKISSSKSKKLKS